MTTSAVSLTVKALLAASPVTAIVSTRVQPLPLKLGTALPAIAVAMSSEDDRLTLSGASQYPESTVQVHCIASTATDAIALGEAVKRALRDLLYTNSDSPPVKASFVKDPLDFTDFADDLTTHRRVMGYSLRWRS
jgi:hypothetical protein